MIETDMKFDNSDTFMILIEIIRWQIMIYKRYYVLRR